MTTSNTTQPHLLEPLVLLECPWRHLACTRQCEHGSRQRAGADCEQHPAHDLREVVGAGDVVEQEPAGDLVALLSWLAQVGQDDVTPVQGGGIVNGVQVCRHVACA